MKKLLLLFLLLPLMVISQEHCWKFNTVEKNGKVGTTTNSEICYLDNLDTVVNLNGSKFYFEYVSHRETVIDNENVVILRTLLGYSDLFLIYIYDDAIMITDPDFKDPTLYYNSF